MLNILEVVEQRRPVQMEHAIVVEDAADDGVELVGGVPEDDTVVDD